MQKKENKKERNQLERQFCTDLQKWMRHNMKFCYAWEAKVVDTRKNNRLSLTSHSTPKEIRNLLIAGSQFIHKFSDIAQWGTPFDGISMHGVAGFFFIRFYKPRKQRLFYVIEASVLAKEVESGAKSINEARAAELSQQIGVLA